MTSRELKFRLQAQKKLKRFWTGILVLIPLVLFWVNQTVSSTKTLYQIQKISDEIEREENHKVALEMLRDRMTSLEFVEWTARNKLGLEDPKRENTVLLAHNP